MCAVESWRVAFGNISSEKPWDEGEDSFIGGMETCRFGERVWKTHLCLEESLIVMTVAHFC